MKIIKFANDIFKHTKPLEDKELEILNKTFKKLLKKNSYKIMRVIVTDNNTQEIIIYNIHTDKFDFFIDNKDESEIIEERLTEFHNLSEISWMILKNEFEIKYRNI